MYNLSDGTAHVLEVVFFSAFLITLSAVTIRSLNKKRRLQTGIAIITTILASLGLFYYYLCDEVVISMKAKIIITGCLIVFYIAIYVFEHFREKISVVLFAIFVNIFSIIIVLLTKR